MIRKAGTLDNRNLGVHATVADEDGTYYGILIGIRKIARGGKTDAIRLAFMDGEVMLLDPEEDVNMTLSGTALTIQDLESTVDTLFKLLTKPAKQ